MFVFISKHSPENFAFLILGLSNYIPIKFAKFLFTNIKKQQNMLKKLAYFLRKIQFLRVNNSRILTIKKAKFSRYYFHINLNILRDFQICISVPLNINYVAVIQLNRTIKLCEAILPRKDDQVFDLNKHKDLKNGSSYKKLKISYIFPNC